MARIPYCDLDQTPPAVQELLKSRRPLNIYRMIAHATTAAPGFLALGGALLRQNELDSQLRELVILRVGILSSAGYEVHQHKRVARSVGVPEAKIHAVAIGPSAPEFSPLERRALEFTDTVVRDVKAPAEQFDALLAELNPRKMAELVLTIGYYMMVSRFLENFEVDIEPATPA
jgi:4-carboxymuconolactone decarboxylase